MKKTPLYQWHVDNGANIADFGNYLMPLWYPQGVKKEHLGVIESGGLFDTSHMAAVLVEGEGARALLQETFTKDLDKVLGPGKTPLVQGRCVYGIFLQENGHVIDDAIVYQVAASFFMVVVNAGMGGTISKHLERRISSADVKITDLTDSLGKIDLQGPESAKIIGELLEDPDGVFSSFPYFSFKGWFAESTRTPVLLKDGTPILLSRTGYTGEFGFEIFLAREDLEKVWQLLLETGGERLRPCGLAARDSLRAGAVLPLSHQDIGDWPFLHNPWLFALPLDEQGAFSKSFIGAEALQKTAEAKHTYPFAGFDPRKITISENSGVLAQDGSKIGDILTCTTDMAIGRVDGNIYSVATGVAEGRPVDFQPKGLSCGFIKVDRELHYGDKVFLTDGKRKVEVEIRNDVRPDRTARVPLHSMR